MANDSLPAATADGLSVPAANGVCVPVFLRVLAVLACAFCCLVIPSLVVEAHAERPVALPVHSFSLAPGVHCQVFPDGAIRLAGPAAARDEFILECIPLQERSRRPSLRANSQFSTVVSEGAPGGLRGFTRDADDDKDGRLDEDYLDGIDNDDDGLVDEDFAAISDQMVVVHRVHASGRLHLETYHWEYGNLGSSVLIASSSHGSNGGYLPGKYIIETDRELYAETTQPSSFYRDTNAGDERAAGVFVSAPEAAADPVHERWHERLVGCHTHSAAGPIVDHRGRAYVCTVPDPEGPRQQLWIGVLPLESSMGAEDEYDRADRPVDRTTVLPDDRLEMPLTDDGLRMVISVARSLPALSNNLASAIAVFTGVEDPSSGQRVRWIVPPLCPLCRVEPNSTAEWIPGPDQGGRLVFAIEPFMYSLFDPDRFAIDGVALGSPVSVGWSREGSEAQVTNWGAAARATAFEQRPEPALYSSDEESDEAGLPRCCDPYGAFSDLLSHRAAGNLVFEFATLPAIPREHALVALTGFGLNGRAFTQELEIPIPESFLMDGNTGAENDTDTFSDERSGNRGPTLNPQLIDNYPNPFRGATNVRYQVPLTIREGFAWETLDGTETAAPPEELAIDPDAAIPYRTNPPRVSVRVYSLSGQELVTLFDGSLPPGQYESSWNGTDSFGSPVASGTYFCKLQVEDWSVTKRLVYLR